MMQWQCKLQQQYRLHIMVHFTTVLISTPPRGECRYSGTVHPSATNSFYKMNRNRPNLGSSNLVHIMNLRKPDLGLTVSPKGQKSNEISHRLKVSAYICTEHYRPGWHIIDIHQMVRPCAGDHAAQFVLDLVLLLLLAHILKTAKDKLVFNCMSSSKSAKTRLGYIKSKLLLYSADTHLLVIDMLQKKSYTIASQLRDATESLTGCFCSLKSRIKKPQKFY